MSKIVTVQNKLVPEQYAKQFNEFLSLLRNSSFRKVQGTAYNKTAPKNTTVPEKWICVAKLKEGDIEKVCPFEVNFYRKKSDPTSNRNRHLTTCSGHSFLFDPFFNKIMTENPHLNISTNYSEIVNLQTPEG